MGKTQTERLKDVRHKEARHKSAFRATMKAIEDTKAELTAKLSDLKTNLGTQVQSVEEKEEASVEEVKENYSKKLEAVKQAIKLKASGGNAAGPGVAEAVKAHEEMKKVEEKLRKKMPTS